MRTSSTQDNNFIKEVISSCLLEDAIAWITNEFSAEELYGKEVLEEWAEDNDYIKIEQ